MKAVIRLLDDMDKLCVHALQELRIVGTDTPDNMGSMAKCFVAVGALTAVSGAIAGAKVAINHLS